MSVLERPPFVPGDSCPCECGTPGSKLSVKTGHVVGCSCRPCLGRRNRKRGKAHERTRHLNLGGSGYTPADELPHTYPLTVTVEDKSGDQLSNKLLSWIDSEQYRHWMQQCKKKIPVGVDALPALSLHPPGGGHFLFVEVKPRRRAA